MRELASRNEQMPSERSIEALVVNGDLGSLSPAQRVEYYRRLCQSLGLNPLTQPFAYLRLSGKLVLYAQKNCTEQLRQMRGISVTIRDKRIENGCAVVEVEARDKDGRTDSDIGVVPIEGLKGEALANAIMKAVTKAKRRVTLSLAGLGWLDESELDGVPGVQVVVDPATGEVREEEPSTTSEPPRSEDVAAAPAEEAGETIAGGRIVHRTAEDAQDRARKLLIQDLQQALREVGITRETAGDWLAQHFDGKRTVKELSIQELGEAVKKATGGG